MDTISRPNPLRTWLDAQPRGAASDLAAAIDIHPVMISIWASGKRPIPTHRCVRIERATKGELTRQILRPDDWQDHWPELAEPKFTRRFRASVAALRRQA